MLSIQKQIEQLEAIANEAELLSYLACDRDTRDHNRQLAIQLRAAVPMVRSRQIAIAA